MSNNYYIIIYHYTTAVVNNAHLYLPTCTYILHMHQTMPRVRECVLCVTFMSWFISLLCKKVIGFYFGILKVLNYLVSMLLRRCANSDVMWG